MATYHNIKKQVKQVGIDTVIAVANSERAAEIIAMVLNRHFGTENYTRNEALEMVHKQASSSLASIADLFEKYEWTIEDAVAYLRELSDEFDAQSLVVAMRDELKFDKPIDP